MKRVLFFVFLLIVAGGLILTLTGKRNKEDILRVTGRVEVDEIIIKTEIPGRVTKLLAREGQEVRKGQILAQIDDSPLRLEKNAIRNQIDAKEEILKAKMAQLDYLEAWTEATIEEARSALRQARSRLYQAEIEFKRLESQYLRSKNLFRETVIPKERYEDVEKAYLLAKSQVEVARAQVQSSKAKLREAQALPLKIKALRQEILALKKEVSALKARLQRIELDIQKSTIRSPSEGVIYRKLTEEGEVLPVLGPLYVLLKPESVHVKTFLPEVYIPETRVGQKVNVYTDAYPERPFEGTICYISDKAEFTPKQIDTSEERVKQVFETKVCFPSPVPELKKGMPVDVIIRKSG